MDDLLRLIGRGLDLLFENIFFIIIILNVVSRFFKSESEPENEAIPTQTTSDDPSDDSWWREVERLTREAQAQAEATSHRAEADYPSEQSYSQSHDQEAYAELDSLIKDHIELSQEAYRESDTRLSQALQLMTESPLLSELIPELASLQSDLSNLNTKYWSRLQSLERAYGERVNSEVFGEAQRVSDEGYSIEERATLLSTLTSSLAADLERVELAQRLTQDQLGPLVRHRQAEGQALAPYPLILPTQLKRLKDEMNEHISGYRSFIFGDYRSLDDMGMWPLKTRSTAQLLRHIAPQWAHEWAGLRGDVRRPQLPRRTQRTLSWDAHEAFNYWGDQLFNVHFMALRYGPTALKALLIELEQRDYADRMISLRSDSKRRRHVPPKAPHLFEVMTVIATLECMGFKREANLLAGPWRKRISKGVVTQSSDGSLLHLSLAWLEESMKTWVERVYQHKWRTWNHTAVADIAGLVCTRGAWTLTQGHTQELAEGKRISEVPSHIHWLTVINIAQQKPQYIAHARLMTERYLRHHHHVNHLRGHSQHQRVGETSRDDLISALVLSDLFTRPRGLRRAR